MKSLIAEELKLKYHPVAISFGDSKPEGARQLQEDTWGCVMAMYSLTIKRGDIAVFDRKTYGCIGAGVGLCLGNTYLENHDFMLNLLCEEEGFLKNHDLVADFLDNFEYVDIPYQYVIFKPLEQIDTKWDKPALISIPANPDQLAALAALMRFRRPGNEHVVVPFGAGCQSICVTPFNESRREHPRAVIGNLDLSARRHLPPEILTFTVPFRIFLEMEEDVPQSFLHKEVWARISKRVGQES